MYTFGQLGARDFTITTYDASGAVVATYDRSFTLR
jgi:hypothetical protein